MAAAAGRPVARTLIPAPHQSLQANAARVADFIAVQCGGGGGQGGGSGQYLVVSHKPQVWLVACRCTAHHFTAHTFRRSHSHTRFTLAQPPTPPLQVYERSGCLVGVYTRDGASDAVTLRLGGAEV